MSIATATIDNPKKVIKPRLRLPRTAAEYLNFNPKNGFKYEWVKGKLLKSTMIKPEHYFIVNNLMRFFVATKAFIAGDSLMPEVKSLTTFNAYRVPDLAFFTLHQVRLMVEKKAQTPLFAIEIISEFDDLIKVEEKLEEYFEAGVSMVWHIIPELEKVYVYTAPDKNIICRGTALVSAEPIIEGFTLAAKDIFKKP